MGRKYNFIYSNLVENNNDIVGHIAYSLYKMDKIAFIERFKDQNNGKEPEEKDIEAFHNISCLENQLNGYKLQSFMLLKDFMDNTVAEVVSNAEREVKDDYRSAIKDVISEFVPKLKPQKFWYGVGQSILGAVLFAVLMAALLFFLNISKQTYTFTIGGNGNTEVTSK